jgi:hypothetical protein
MLAGRRHPVTEAESRSWQGIRLAAANLRARSEIRGELTSVSPVSAVLESKIPLESDDELTIEWDTALGRAALSAIVVGVLDDGALLLFRESPAQMRFASRFRVTVRCGAGSRERTCTIVSISGHGALLDCPAPMIPGSEITFRFLNNTLRAKVASCQGMRAYVKF